MELSYSDLRKREVINMVDGRSLGKVCDLSLDFPDGVLTGIFVPGKRNRGIFHIFDRTKIFIPESNIVKIGGDVILVDLRKETNATLPSPQPTPPCPPPCTPCVPICPPPHVKGCSSQNNSSDNKQSVNGISFGDFQNALNGRYDDGDY